MKHVKIKEINVEASAGSSLNDSFRDAIKLAIDRNEPVRMFFNDVSVFIDPKQIVDDYITEWEAERGYNAVVSKD